MSERGILEESKKSKRQQFITKCQGNIPPTNFSDLCLLTSMDVNRFFSFALFRTNCQCDKNLYPPPKSISYSGFFGPEVQANAIKMAN